MMHILHISGTLIRPARWMPMVMLFLAAGLSGCAGWNMQDEGFRKNNDLSDTARQARSADDPKEKDKDKDKDKNVNYWSFSEKGRQIERDLAPQ